MTAGERPRPYDGEHRDDRAGPARPRYGRGLVLLAVPLAVLPAWWAGVGRAGPHPSDEPPATEFPAVEAGPAAGTGTPAATGAGPPTELPRSDPFPVPAVDGPGPVLVVGDSLTVGAESDGRLSARLSQAGWSPELVAVSGQSTRWGVEQVRQRAEVPEVVVVELGTNPWSTVGTFPADVEAMIDALEARGARAVVWVTPVAGDGTGRYDDKAEVLYAAADEHPSLVVADWRPVADRHPEWFRSDGLHYTDEGNAGLARFMTDAVGSLVS